MHNFLLHHLLQESAKNYPQRPAVVLNGHSLDYQSLETKSNQLANLLIKTGVSKGDRVGIILNKSIESIISIFGILKAGAVYVPIDPRFPRSRIKFIVNNCQMSHVITSNNTLEKIDFTTEVHLPLTGIILVDDRQTSNQSGPALLDIYHWETLNEQNAEHPNLPAICDQQPAYILFTSGSTGTPKGVVISHLNGLSFVNMAVDFFNVAKEDKVGSYAPLNFDLSVFDIFCAVKAAATLVLIPEFFFTFPQKLANYIEEQKISVWNSVSSALVMLVSRLKLKNQKLNSLRLIHFSGEILPIKYLRQLKELMPNGEFYNIYGQSEANSSTCFHIKEIENKDDWIIPIGKPFPNFETFVLDENNEIVSQPGSQGELYVKSATVALGYLGDEERSKKSFLEFQTSIFDKSKVYKTGDIVRVDKDYNYLFIGRKDKMIKSRGYRIELNEIEQILVNHPSVKEVAVSAIPDDLIGNKIIAHLCPIESENLIEQELFDHCGKSLPKYMIPEVMVIQNNLPKTSTGKIDRNLLKTEFLK